MMEYISSEIVGIIYQLLPGFITACIFYLLTSYTKPAPFERVIQALIFTVITKALIIVIHFLYNFTGNHFGKWNENVEFVASIFFAVMIGIIISWCANNDFPLWLFRKDGLEKCTGLTKFIVGMLSTLNLTNKTLHPTEWYSFFKESEHDVVLHLDGERRLKGYLMQFPDCPEDGHFIVINASWLLDDGKEVPLLSVEKILISAKEVIWVELIKSGTTIKTEEFSKSYKLIYSLYNNSEKDGSNDNQCPEKAPS